VAVVPIERGSQGVSNDAKINAPVAVSTKLRSIEKVTVTDDFFFVYNKIR
jgi:hypothetical protein